MAAMPALYLVRHGIAEDRSASGRDEDRALTRDGTEKMQRATVGLASLDVKPDAIWSSPLRRAVQTAELVRDAIAPGLELLTEPRLRPEADVDAMLQGLQAASGVQALMLVGHEPTISALASALLTGSTSGARMPFKPGSALAIELTSVPPAGRGSLRWFLTQEQLRRLSA
jgi:phosphohistidine phosphatase